MTDDDDAAPMLVAVLAYSDGVGGDPLMAARRQAWWWVGVLAWPVAMASLLATALVGVAGVTVAAEAARGLTPGAAPAPLSAAEAAAVVAHFPQLTPMQAATFGMRLQQPGQRFVDPPVPPWSPELTVVRTVGQTTTVRRSAGWTSAELVMDDAGRRLEESSSAEIAEGFTSTQTDAAGRTTTECHPIHGQGPAARAAAGGLVAATAVADLAAIVILVVAAVLTLRRSDRGPAWARRYAAVQWWAAAVGTAAMIWMLAAVIPPRPHVELLGSVVIPVVLGLAACVFPLVVRSVVRPLTGR